MLMHTKGIYSSVTISASTCEDFWRGYSGASFRLVNLRAYDALEKPATPAARGGGAGRANREELARTHGLVAAEI